MSPNSTLYECHVTIEPVENEELEKFKFIASCYKFRVANLVMVKDRKVSETRSNKDSFCTGHSVDYEDMRGRMEALVKDLQTANFQVFRYKIEQILLDVRLV